MGHMKKKKQSPNKRKKTPPATASFVRSKNWVDDLSFQPIKESSVRVQAHQSLSNNTQLTVISWNVLAEAYCSRRSQCNLPPQYAKKVFDRPHRRQQILGVLRAFIVNQAVDVLCLQEVDLDEIGVFMQAQGFVGIETPRTTGGGAGGRSDACSIWIRKETWTLQEHELIRLDDLATLSSGIVNGDNDNTADISNDSNGSAVSSSNLQGLQASFLRRNAALLVRIKHVETGQTLVVANAHLYWHPGYEYVKLCQAHYILKRCSAFHTTNEPVVFCGDLNSRPNSFAHAYLSRGVVNAKHVAPWYRQWDQDANDSWEPGENDGDEDVSANGKEEPLADELGKLQLTDKNDTDQAATPRVRYLLDFTLNKLCRWLRILGVDTALETDDEEKARTGKSQMLLFDRCKEEQRSLVTTSTRLLQRRDCPPGAYCISPANLPNLEVALVHLLLTHGVVLEPKNFLSRCVVCNGMICSLQEPTEKRRILQEHKAPPGLSEEMDVFECDGCQQGYWWCDRPTSSASRVKIQATRIFELCLKAGVPIAGETPHMFEFVDVDKHRQDGWDYDMKGSELLKQKLDVIGWLKDERLACPFELESAYAHKDDKGNVHGETLPFTNVTDSFVNTLDYIFFDKQRIVPTELLDIPTSFPQLNGGNKVRNAHLLPSNIWPSDHLAIGTRLTLVAQDTEKQDVKQTQESPALQFCVPTGNGMSPPPPPPVPTLPTNEHRPKCDCGCVPQIKSLFEMAELRKQARRKKAMEESK